MSLASEPLTDGKDTGIGSEGRPVRDQQVGHCVIRERDKDKSPSPLDLFVCPFPSCRDVMTTDWLLRLTEFNEDAPFRR